MVSESPEPPAGRLCVGRCCPTCQPSSRIGENPPYGMIGRVEETSASFEARSAPRLYPTERLGVKFPGPTRPPFDSLRCEGADAIGAKRTCRGAAHYPAGLTPSGINASRAQCA